MCSSCAENPAQVATLQKNVEDGAGYTEQSANGSSPRRGRATDGACGLLKILASTTLPEHSIYKLFLTLTSSGSDAGSKANSRAQHIIERDNLKSFRCHETIEVALSGRF